MKELNEKIPKIIHYCWFGGKPLPEDLRKCVDSWSKLEGYTVMRWDESNCSFDENEFVRKTYAEKKLGFIGDYYRLKAVYEYGGIYLDTDVKVFKSFDPLLDYPVFLNFIFDCSVGSAIIGARKGSPFIKALLDMYDSIIFGQNDNGKTLQYVDGKIRVQGMPASNYFYTYYILKHYPEFRLNNKFQDLKDFVIFPKELFEIGTLTKRHYAIHFCAGEWRIKEDTSDTFWGKMKKLIQKDEVLFDHIQIMVRKRRYKRLNKEIPFYEYSLAQKEQTALPEL